MLSNKYPEDLALCEQFGVKGIRISLSWTRILSEGEGRVNQKGIDYYNKLIDACIAHGVEPFVTLHHFDTPLAYFHAGGWENRALIDHFVDYARVCFEAFGDRVRKWATFNESWLIAQNGYIAGNFPPHHTFELGRAILICCKADAFFASASFFCKGDAQRPQSGCLCVAFCAVAAGG